MARELELNVRPIFSTPLLVLSIPESEQINAELKQAVLGREASEPTYHDREVIGWSSPHDMSMMDWAGGPLKQLFEYVIQVATQATEYSERTGKSSQRPAWQVVEIWANVQRSGGSNGSHAHPDRFGRASIMWMQEIFGDGKERRGTAALRSERLPPPDAGALPALRDPPTARCRQHHLLHADLRSMRHVSRLAIPCCCSVPGQTPRISVAFNLDPILPK